MDPNVKKVAKDVAGTGARTVGEIILLALRVIGTVILIVLTTGILFTCIFANYVKNNLANEAGIELKSFSQGLTSIIYATDSNTGGYVELAHLKGTENRIWAAYSEIPKDMEHAAVAIEDKRFYTHQGVDWYRTLGAVKNMFFGDSTFGGSTIDQQLIKNRTQRDEVTVTRKLLEIFSALELERNYSKEEIMEWYLNSIYLGERCYGVATAAQEYFGKDLSELTTAECASIIAITNNPSMYDPYIDKEANNDRKELILTEMYKQGYIETEEEYNAAMRQKLVFARAEDEEDETVIFSWFVEAVIEDVISDFMEEYNVSYDTAELYLFNGGYKIYTTVDLDLQAKVDSIYNNLDEIPSASKVSATQQLRSSMVIIDPYTGNIVALAGDVGEKTQNRILNYATQTKRPPGSSIKPIAVYAPAMQLGLITPATVFNDDAGIHLTGTGWYPNNDTYSYSGDITVSEAVRRSVNTVAAQVMDLLTPQNSFDFLTSKLGVKNLTVPDDVDYSALALGQVTNGLSVREMASAYTCFVNSGIWTESRTYTLITDDKDNVVYENIPDTTVALSEKTAYYAINLMTGVVTGGTGYAARVDNMPTAGKTGASSGWKDRWFCGCTPYYVGAVWSGYEIPEGMGSGNPSTQLFRKVMNLVHENLEYKDFNRPDGSLSYYSVCKDCGGRAIEACSLDIRGSRAESVLLYAEDAPSSTCSCHTTVSICKDSGKLAGETCPEDMVTTVGVIDDLKDDLPKVVNITRAYTDETTGEPIKYLLSDYGEEICDSEHIVGFWSEWAKDEATGYYINPDTGYLYDPEGETYYDKLTGWNVDPETGYLFDPNLPGWVYPGTLQPVPETPDPSPSPSEDPSPSPSPSPDPSPSPPPDPEPPAP